MVYMWNDQDFANYIVGQADADSSFYLAVKRQKAAKFRFQVLPSWSMDKVGDIELLTEIRDFLGVGKIYEPKAPKKTREGYERHRRGRLTVNGFDCLKLVEFFDKFPLRGKKRYDYELWKEGVQIYYARSRRGSHKKAWTKTELMKMLELKQRMAGRLKSKPTLNAELLKTLLST